MANPSVLAGDGIAYAGDKKLHHDHNARAERALELYRTHGADIEHLEGEIYLVPSSDGRRMYRVDYANECCQCADFSYRREVCKHIYMVGISLATRRAKRCACDGCSRRFPIRELVVLDENNHDNLTYFSGQFLCRECADAAGVIR